MGVLDFLKPKSAIEKHAGRVANKRVQAVDRMDSIRALARMGTEEAATNLLARFNFKIDPSITDKEEKDEAFEGLVAMGAPAVEPVKAYLRASESISWPLKMLERLVPPEEVTSVLLELLSSMDTEYERDPERKVQVVSYLEDHRDPRIAPAVRPFLADANETVRFHAMGTLFAQDSLDDSYAGDLLAAFMREESVRLRVHMCEGFAAQGWRVPEGDREKVRDALPDAFSVDMRTGEIKKRA